jgi:hypothetical protein
VLCSIAVAAKKQVVDSFGGGCGSFKTLTPKSVYIKHSIGSKFSDACSEEFVGLV